MICLFVGMIALAADVATSIGLTSNLNPSAPGASVTFTATVVPAPSGGTVVFYDDGVAISGVVNVNITSGIATFDTSSLASGTHPITAVYSGHDDGTDNFLTSTSSVLNQKVKNGVAVVVFLADTSLIVGNMATGTVTLIDTSGNPSSPTGNVTLSHTGTGTLDLPLDGGLTHNVLASEGGQFEFTYIATADDLYPAGHVITASYVGDADHAGGTDTFEQDIVKRAADVEFVLSSSSAYINEPISCVVVVEDDTTEGTQEIPQGDVTFSATVNGNPATLGVFTPSATVSPITAGAATVIYTPACFEIGSTVITAMYSGSVKHAGATKNAVVTVAYRPTEALTSIGVAGESLLVNEVVGITVDVMDASGAPHSSTPISPTGILTVTKSLVPTSEGVLSLISGPASAGITTSWMYTYVRTHLDADGADIDVITTGFVATDGIYEDSLSSCYTAIKRRPTETTLSGCVSSLDGVIGCTATVAEEGGLAGTSSLPLGNIVTKEDLNEDQDFKDVGEVIIVGAAPIAVFGVPSDKLMTNVAVQYEPGNRIHLSSTAGELVDRSDQFPAGDGDGSDGSGCNPGCGSGGVDVDNFIYLLNAESEVLHAGQMAFEVISLGIGVIPEPEGGCGIPCQGGSTVPVTGIGQAVVGGIGLALEIAITTMQADMDGDGIPDVVEYVIGTSSTEPDSDGDGMDDASEVSAASGYSNTGPASSRTGTRRPDPVVADSDGDGLKDGYEADTTKTDFCSADTDCDTIPDGVESASWLGVTSGFDGFVGYLTVDETQFMFDIKDQLDALQPDSDGDGLDDADEWLPGVGATVTDGYANVSDSDGDGLVDYLDTAADLPDANGNSGELGNDTDPGNQFNPFGHSIGDPDSDGDGLLDGEEYWGTTNWLDWDSDNDGLSDSEELQVYFTDPNDPDSDDDTAAGIIPSRPTGTPLAGYSGSYANILLGSDGEEALSRTGVTPFEALGDQSDPLQKDTDGDGIGDELEFTPGCNCDGTVLDGYVNDDDSDNDGLQDGEEYALFGIGADIAKSNGNDGELNDDLVCSLCDYDSDGDGLSDGEEVFTGTDPLDWDPDDDGLSDLEELQNYFTDPNMSDTDGDTAGVANPVIAARPPAFTDAAHPALTGHSGNGSIGCGSDCQEVYSGTLLFNPFYSQPVPAPGISGYGSPLDQTDPLQMDTDGDGINDDIEFNPGCNDGPGGPGTGTALFDGFANSFDSDADGLRDYEDAIGDVFSASTITINNIPVTRDWLTYFETPLPVPGTFKAASPDRLNDGELGDDIISCMCDSDSDNDGVLDGDEHQIGTDPYDWDTDDDGRPDSEYLGNGPIPTDPLDFDTDDDGLGDGVEVYGANPTNPVNADTDFDGLADGGSTTPASGGQGTLTGGVPVDGAGTNGLVVAGVAGHPNNNSNGSGTPIGYGEDVDGNGTQGGTETNPNDLDSDNDGIGDGVEVLAYTSPRAIPSTDMLGQTILVEYPQQVHTNTSTATAYSGSCACLNPLLPDTDFDGLDDGIEDLNHDGNFDFYQSDFDFQDLLDGAPQPDPEETNPCDPDTDHDGLTDDDERLQPNPGTFLPFNPTNPLDHDTDNDWLFDGEEVYWTCIDPGFNLDPDLDGIDDYYVLETLGGVLDPTNRDSDSDGFIDGLDPNPCYSWLRPIGLTLDDEWFDSDGDGFSDVDEFAAGTNPFDGDVHPIPFIEDFDRNFEIEDAIWLEDYNNDAVVDSVAIDIDSDYLVDVRVWIIGVRDLTVGDFDADGAEDDLEVVVVYAFANGRYIQPRVVLTVIDLDSDFVIVEVQFE